MKVLCFGLRLSIVGLLGLILSGCGSLNQSVSYERLTSDNIDLVKNSGPSMISLNMDIGGRKFESYQTANKCFIVPPIIYWDSLGYDSGQYGYMRMIGLWPLLMHSGGAIYDRGGDMTRKMSLNSLCPVFAKATAEDSGGYTKMSMVTLIPIPIVGISLWNQARIMEGDEVKLSRYSFLNLPIIGPCFAVRHGEDSGRPRFLWIPCGPKE